MREARSLPGVKKVLVASGIRMDLARQSPEYIRELTRHHVGGHLKVAPEHVDPNVLFQMRKPANDDFEHFTEVFTDESAKAGKKQYLIPYFIASHPASDLDAMIELAVFLKQNGYKPDQVQDFIPAPLDVATCIYYTGIDPFTKKPVYVAKALRERKMQRALMQFFKPENYFEVRDALREAGRSDLIGDGCDALIPALPPKEAIQKRREDANQRFRGEYVHKIPGKASNQAAQRPRPQERSADAPKLDENKRKKGSKKQRRDRGTAGYRPAEKGPNKVQDRLGNLLARSATIGDGYPSQDDPLPFLPLCFVGPLPCIIPWNSPDQSTGAIF